MPSRGRAFLAMPFSPALLYVRDAIATACRQQQVELRIVDETTRPGGSIFDMLSTEIARCTLGIVVLNELRPNVMYELGLLHGQGKPTILLADSTDPKAIPFDLRSLFIIECRFRPSSAQGIVDRVAAAISKVFLLEDEDTRMEATAEALIPADEQEASKQVFMNIDFERIKDSAAQYVNRQGCRTVNLAANAHAGYDGWTLKARCRGGETIVVHIDLNGRIREVDVMN